jgi:hypothetical protein
VAALFAEIRLRSTAYTISSVAALAVGAHFGGPAFVERRAFAVLGVVVSTNSWYFPVVWLMPSMRSAWSSLMRLEVRLVRFSVEHSSTARRAS